MEEPAGWRTAVALLRIGLRHHEVVAAVRAEFDLEPEEAEAAVEFGTAWLAEARADRRRPGGAASSGVSPPW